MYIKQTHPLTRHFGRNTADNFTMDNASVLPADNATISDDNASDISTDVHYKMMDNTRIWFTIIFVPLGVVGNILCLLVVLQKQNHSISCSVYMGALAVMDTVVLLGSGMRMYMKYHCAVEIMTEFCKASAYIVLTSSQCGSMIILALLLERVIVVTKPLKAAPILSPKRALLIIFVIFILLAVFNVPQIFAFTVGCKQMKGCQPTALSTVTTAAYSFFVLFISGILPLFGILVMNLIILCAIKPKKSKKRQAKNRATQKRSRLGSVSHTETSQMDSADGDSAISTISRSGSILRSNLETDPICGVDEVDISVRQAGGKGKEKTEKQLTMMTVVMTTAFLVCVTPYYIRTLLLALVDVQNRIVIDWTNTVARILIVFNSAINFFIYIATGSKFRSDLVNLFRVKCKGGQT